MYLPPVSFEDAQTELESCGVQAARCDDGWRLTSMHNRFDPLTIADSVARWERGQGRIGAGPWFAVLLDTALRISFQGGSVLGVYASGHIRWIPERGLRCFAVMTGGGIPVACQGDLVVYRLPDDGIPGCLDSVAAILPEDTGQLWCKPAIVRCEPVGEWRETTALAAGGNRRHVAIGHFRYRFIWPADHRTIQVHSLGPLCLEHNPVDAIHPTLNLPAGADFLVTKLPGFSNPAAEISPARETLR